MLLEINFSLFCFPFRLLKIGKDMKFLHRIVPAGKMFKCHSLSVIYGFTTLSCELMHPHFPQPLDVICKSLRSMNNSGCAASLVDDGAALVLKRLRKSHLDSQWKMSQVQSTPTQTSVRSSVVTSCFIRGKMLCSTVLLVVLFTSCSCLLTMR